MYLRLQIAETIWLSANPSVVSIVHLVPYLCFCLAKIFLNTETILYLCFILEYMIVVDLLIAVLLGYGLYKGWRNGLIISVVSLVALIAGICFSLRFSFFTRELLMQYTQWNPNVTTIAAFFITFLTVLILIHLLGKLMTKIVETLALGFINKLTGALFEGIKIVLIISVLLNLFQKINHDNLLVSEHQLNESVFYQPVQEVSKYVFPLMEKWYELGLNEATNEIKELKER